jgi:hypothetical protein
MRPFFVIFLAFIVTPVFSQKMLLLERANSAKPTKIYIGDNLQYRLTGQEDYWYHRTITNMLPEKNTLLLDNFPVKLGDIGELKVRRKGVWRIVGGTLFAFGASLALATTIAALYGDNETNYGALYATSVASAGIGFYLSTKRTLKMDQKHRLRIIEIQFSQPVPEATPKQ